MEVILGSRILDELQFMGYTQPFTVRHRMRQWIGLLIGVWCFLCDGGGMKSLPGASLRKQDKQLMSTCVWIFFCGILGSLNSFRDLNDR